MSLKINTTFIKKLFSQLQKICDFFNFSFYFKIKEIQDMIYSGGQIFWFAFCFTLVSTLAE